jgi:hypothetical protein
LRAEFGRRLRESGLVVHEAYGTTAHPIDLAVEDPRSPGSVLVAVETDGPVYASMRSTRDRDRLRAEQLSRLGWEHVRVWSTDLFRDPARDVSRVHAAVQQAAARATASERPAVALDPAQPAGQRGSDALPPAAVVPSEDEAGRGDAGGPEAGGDGAGGDAAGEESEAFVPQPDDTARQRRLRGRKVRRPLEQSSDDTDEGWGERRDSSAHDRWLQEQRPPHWGSD